MRPLDIVGKSDLLIRANSRAIRNFYLLAGLATIEMVRRESSPPTSQDTASGAQRHEISAAWRAVLCRFQTSCVLTTIRESGKLSLQCLARVQNFKGMFRPPALDVPRSNTSRHSHMTSTSCDLITQDPGHRIIHHGSTCTGKTKGLLHSHTKLANDLAQTFTTGPMIDGTPRILVCMRG